MYVGIDIGSSTSKVAILNEEKRLTALSVVNLGTGTDGVSIALKEAYRQAGITHTDIKYTVTTGYGRMIYADADAQMTEISCHAKGAFFLSCRAGTIIDIGGQDSKVMKVDVNGRVLNFTMNEKCAAGTGRFLEVMSRVLGCRLEELAALAEGSARDVSISSVCTVFAESEAISRLASGENRSDVARGAHRAVARRIAGMYHRVGGCGPVAMTGGVALNADLVQCLSEELQITVTPVQHSQLAGAIGAAVYACEKYRGV